MHQATMRSFARQRPLAAGTDGEHLFSLFARSVRDFPDNVALDLGDNTYTYRELADLVERIAALLYARGLRPQDTVGLCTHRRDQTYAGYLAVLRLGGVLVPLSAQTPAARMCDIIASAGVRLVLASGNDLPAQQLPVPVLDAAAELDISTPPPAPPVAHSRDDLAYVLFTSGSTGRPKGVPIRHRNVSAYLRYAVHRFAVDSHSRLSQTFELTFDPSVFDLFAAWSSGATVVVPQLRELLLPARYVNMRAITHWFSVPSVVSIARRIDALKPETMPGLRYSQFAGEQLTVEQAEAWRQAAPYSEIDNTYGPTELTVTCTAYRLDRDLRRWPRTGNGTVPIGRINDELEYLILGEDGRPSEDGELCVRGPQRFDGYLDPRDNVGRFVTFDGETATVIGDEDISDAHWYRTGDRVRRDGDELLHLGRIDRQVKISGYRIELGEIEGALRRLPGILDAVVALDDAADPPRLCAVLVGVEQEQRDIEQFLRARLPAYMVPTRYGWLPELPLNANGKTDFAQLKKYAATLTH